MALRMILSLLIVPYLLVSSQETCPASSDSCFYDNVAVMEAETDVVNKHFYLGGLFGIHEHGVDAYSCDKAALRSRGIINLEAFMWAIKNYQGTDLNRVFVGGLGMDSCSMAEKTIENILSYELCKIRVAGPTKKEVSPRNLMAYVGPDRSAEARATAVLLREMNRTLVSHAATSPMLTNGDNPFFLRTVPSDKYDSKIMTSLLADHLQAKYVQAVYLGNSYGRDGFHMLKNELHAKKVCVVADQELPVSASEQQMTAVIDKIMQNKVTRYVILYLDKDNAKTFLAKFKNEQPNEIQNFIFFGTSSWAEDSSVTLNTQVSGYTISLDAPSILSNDVERFYTYFDNLKPRNNSWNPWFKAYWDGILGCDQNRVCDENVDTIAGRYSRDVYVPYTLMAVKAVIDGVRAKANEICTQNDMCSKFLNERNRGQNIFEGIRLTRENNIRVFDDMGDLAQSFVRYKLVRVSTGNTYTVNVTKQPRQSSTTTQAATTAVVKTTTDPTEGGVYAFAKMVANQQFTGAFSKQMRGDGVQIVIDTQWLIQVPPEVVKVVTNNGEEAWVCNHFTWSAEKGWLNMASFIRTNFENDLLSLVYIMFLILMTTIVAMKAHGIITNHRESVFIGIGAGFSIPIWIAWGLVGGLNRDHDFAQEFGDACMAFGLFITATLALFSMFLPKVRQLVNMGVEGIYLEDDRDTYYAGSVIMAPPSYKSRPSSMVYVNQGMYSEPVIIGNGEQNSVHHLKQPGSTYSLPIYTKKGSELGGSKVLKVTGDLTGKHPATERRKPVSEYGYYRKTRSESGGTLR
ncbi:hypothetical protein KUTeg_009990, partial [Tegillarca granosa]